jgi:uncharacterized membrane protein YqiK
MKVTSIALLLFVALFFVTLVRADDEEQVLIEQDTLSGMISSPDVVASSLLPEITDDSNYLFTGVHNNF